MGVLLTAHHLPNYLGDGCSPKEADMAHTTVSDFVIWTKHIHGDPRVEEHILALKAGETIELKVDGVRGPWRRMSDGKDGRPTRGIRPVGRMQDFWNELYASRRKDVVTLELADDGPAGASPSEAPVTYPCIARTEADRQAALEAFLAAGEQGWRSDGPYGRREELYDR